MGNVVVGIHQPNFMPWIGYFLKIWRSDIFIFLDDVQFQKTGSNYTNRVSLNINGKSVYFTVPVKRKEGYWNINETEFADNKWKKKLIATLQSNYAKAPFFKNYKDFIFELINYNASNLADYNINFIKNVSNELGFNVKFIRSSDLNVKTNSTQRLVDLIKRVGGNVYLSGKGGDNYQDHKLFEKENIMLIYNEIPNIEYGQLKTEKFIPGLSVIDIIFNIGFEEIKNKFLKKVFN